MNEHDPMCPKRGLHPADEAMMAVVVQCRCEEYARVRADERERVGRVWAKREDLLLGDIEVARADERERIVAELEGPARESEAMYAHAEAVAAKLVEVICEMQAEADEEDAYFLTSYQRIRAQRDAARADAIRYSDEIDCMVRELSSIRMEHEAEVAALREQLSHMYQAETFTDTDGYPSIRVIKAIERVDENEWAMIIRREVLADLRAKVEGLRDEAIRARRGTVAENGLDTVPSAWHNGRTSLADAVLALIDKAQPKQRTWPKTLRVELEDDDANISE